MRPALVVTAVTLSVCAALPLRADPPPCPRAEPTRGTPCTSPGLRCGYGGRCGGHRARYAVCDRHSHTWRMERGPTCNPPGIPVRDPLGLRSETYKPR